MQFSKYKFVRKLAMLIFYLKNRDANKLRIVYNSDGLHIQIVNILGYCNLLVLPIKVIE